jgi:hypothetical protein
MPDPQWYTKQGPDGKWYKTQASSMDEARAKLSRAWGNASPAPRETAVDQMFPAGGTVGAPHPRTGLEGLEDTLSNLRTRLSQFAQRGAGQSTGDFMASLPLGLLRAGKGLTEVPQGKLWQGTKDVVGGGLEAGTIPLSFVAPEKAGTKVGSVALDDAAKVITNAVNPVPEKMGRFQSELAKHFDKIVTFAAQHGINIDSPEGLGRAMKQAGSSVREHYYDKILGPVKELPVDVTSIPGYAGKTATSPSTATLADLDARLSQINADLNPKFAKKGEIAAQAAVKSAGDLNAEASAIRAVLYPRLAQATGLTPEVIAQTRQAFGSLRELAEQTNEAATKARFAANKEAQAPLTVNPFSGSKGKQFLADKVVNAVRPDPIKGAIKNAVSKADVPRYRLPEPDPVAARSALRPPRQPPIRGVSKAAGKVVETSPEEVAEHAKKFGEREAQVLKSRNKTLRRPIWADIGTGGTTPAP